MGSDRSMRSGMPCAQRYGVDFGEFSPFRRSHAVTVGSGDTALPEHARAVDVVHPFADAARCTEWAQAFARPVERRIVVDLSREAIAKKVQVRAAKLFQWRCRIAFHHVSLPRSGWTLLLGHFTIRACHDRFGVQ